MVKLSKVFGVTLDELVKGETGQFPEPEAHGASASAPEGSQPAAAPAAELLRLHRQKLAGILLMVISLAVTLLNFALFFITLPVFAAGVLCLLVRRRLGLAIGWTLWIFALFITRSATSVSMSQLLSPGYWQNTALLAPLLALVQLAALVLLAWRTLRNPPGLKACWTIWLGLLAALWLPTLWILSVPRLQPLSAGEVLVNFFPLLFPDYYRNAPLGAALWLCYVLALVWLVRRTWRAAGTAKN